jgi:hypothetical protein
MLKAPGTGRNSEEGERCGRVGPRRDTLLGVIRFLQTVLALAVAACSSAPPPEPVVPSERPKQASQTQGNDVEPGTPMPAPEPPSADAMEPDSEPSAPAKTEDPGGLAASDDDAKDGAACTVTDSNGPEPGGTRTDSCPEGQSCFCDRAGGYACAGTCRRGAPAKEERRRCPCPPVRNRFGEFEGGYCSAKACATDGQLLSCHDNGWVGLKAVCKER